MSESNREENKQPKEKSVARETFDSIVVAFVIAALIRIFILGVYKIPSGSMLDTLQIGDHILVNQLSYIFTGPKHDDIIVFEYPLEPNKDFIKRVIGIPGDRIKIMDKVLYRNGEKVEQYFTRFSSNAIKSGEVSPRDNVAEFTVPEKAYFVMGDNRDDSLDSRFWGLVDKDAIVGRAFMIYWSWDPASPMKIRFNRLFNLL